MPEYTCTLDEASLQKAKAELHEDPKERLGAVEHLREWINQQSNLKFPTDTAYLLLFLRYAKFSQLKARETVKHYCEAMVDLPQWFSGYDAKAAKIVEFLRTGTMFPLPGRDDNGQTVMMYRASAYSAKEWKKYKDEMSKAMYMIFHHAVRDERTQVNGIVFFDDMTGLTMAHQTFYSMDETKKMLKLWQSVFPARYKAFHEYNIGPIFEAMMTLMMPFLTKKFRDRMILHGSNMEDVYKAIPMRLLPLEYLPDDYKGPNNGSVSQIVDKLIADLHKPDNYEYLCYISRADFGMDKSQKQHDVPSESFRKLNVD